MTSIKHKFLLVFLFSLLFSIASQVVQAGAFNLSFFDKNNQQVGRGQFTADPNKIVTWTSDDNPFIQGCLGNGQTLRECGLVRDFNNQLTQFSASIQGTSSDKATTLDVQWGLETTAWWTGEGHPPGQLSGDRTHTGFEGNAWFFGDPFFGFRQLRMDFNAATDSSGSGTWLMQAGYADTNGQNPLPAFVSGDGTFTITATPIPAAVWLFASGLGMLGVFNRKRQ